MSCLHWRLLAVCMICACDFDDPLLSLAVDAGGGSVACAERTEPVLAAGRGQNLLIDDFETGSKDTQADCAPFRATCDGITTNALRYRTRTYCDRDTETHLGVVCAELLSGDAAYEGGTSLKLTYDIASQQKGVYAGYAERLTEDPSAESYRGAFNLDALPFGYLTFMIRADDPGVDLEVALKDEALRQTNMFEQGKLLASRYVVVDPNSTKSESGIPSLWSKVKIPLRELAISQEARGEQTCLMTRRLLEINFGLARDRFDREAEEARRRIPLSGVVYLDDFAFEQ